MNEQERKALAEFMRMMIIRCHTDVRIYPLIEMQQLENYQGIKFEGTKYATDSHLHEAYEMVKHLLTISKADNEFGMPKPTIPITPA